jgi:hypothetical protein
MMVMMVVVLMFLRDRTHGVKHQAQRQRSENPDRPEPERDVSRRLVPGAGVVAGSRLRIYGKHFVSPFVLVANVMILHVVLSSTPFPTAR